MWIKNLIKSNPLPLIFSDNYAVVVECKNLNGPIYLAVTIGSRQKTLDESIVKKLRQEITSKTGIDLSEMKAIDQVQCN